MVGCLQQRCLIVIILANCILLCNSFGIDCERECCYRYRQFPATPSICNEMFQTTTVTLLCEIEYWLLNNSTDVEVKWYRSRDEHSAGIDGEMLASNDQCMQYNRTIRQCYLRIMPFSISDTGYYWCQMVVNNVSLSPSPHGHINSSQCHLFGVTCNKTDDPYCACNKTTTYMARIQETGNNCLLENAGDIAATSRSAMTSMSTTEAMTDSFDNTTKSTVSTLSSKYPTTITIDSSRCNPSKEGYPCLIGITVGTVLLIAMTIVVLGISFYLFRMKHKNQCKPDDTLELEECNEFANPHYSEVRVAINDSLKQTESDDGQGDNGLPLLHKGSTVNNLTEKQQRDDSGSSKPKYENQTTQQYQQSHGSRETDVEEKFQLNNGCSSHQETRNTTADVSSVYAVVNKNKKPSNLQSNENLALKADDDDRINQDESTEATAKRTEYKDLRDRSPSPEYAELSTREKKVPAVTKCSENDSKSDSHVYDKLADMAEVSANVTKEDAEEVEQHYYYTLENPEESCSNSERKEETTKTINSGEMEYSIPQAHHLAIDNVPIAPNIDAKAELVSVREINASPS